MKRCPKCNRTFPEDTQKFCTVDGGLLIAEVHFDPNATIRATPADLGIPEGGYSSELAATSRKLPDLGETIAAPRPTSPAKAKTSADLPPVPAASAPAEAPAAKGPPPVAKKKSKLPLILGILAVLLILGIGGIAAAFFFVIKPRLDQMQDQPIVAQDVPTPEVTNTNEVPANTNTAPPASEVADFVPPDGAAKFENSKDNLDGKLAEHYLDFSFYYPESWQSDSKAGVAGATNFVKVERMLPPDFTQENFAVGWYTSKGTYEADLPTFPQLVELLSASLSKGFPEYRKVSEGPTKVNSMDAYEFRFVSLSKGTEKGDIQVWGRVIFLPSGSPGQTAGATLIMLATSLAPELSGIDDVGDKGQMPIILESFRFAKK